MMDLKNFKCYYYLRASVRLAQGSKGDAPVYVRFQSSGIRKEMSTGVFGNREYWSNNLKRFDHQGRMSQSANKQLQELEKRIEFAYWKTLNLNDTFDLDVFLESLYGKKEKYFLIAVFKKRLEQLHELEGNGYAKSTITTYKVALKHLENYLKSMGQKDVALGQLNPGFIRGFFEFLRLTMSNNSAVKYIRKLRAVLNYAMDNEWLDKNPCSGFKMRDTEVVREALTKEELERLAKKDFGIERLDEVRDLFLFQCYTGLAFKDIQELKTEHLIEEEGIKYIIKKRKKTDVQSIIPVLPQVELILRKYQKKRVLDYLLPVPTNQKMNAYLKEIAALCKIDKELSSHIGRHTFATSMLNNGMGLDFLQPMMGMTSTKHLKGYAKLSKSTLYDQMKNAGRFDH